MSEHRGVFHSKLEGIRVKGTSTSPQGHSGLEKPEWWFFYLLLKEKVGTFPLCDYFPFLLPFLRLWRKSQQISSESYPCFLGEGGVYLPQDQHGR